MIPWTTKLLQNGIFLFNEIYFPIGNNFVFFFPLTLLHSEWPKLHRVLAILRAKRVKSLTPLSREANISGRGAAHESIAIQLKLRRKRVEDWPSMVPSGNAYVLTNLEV